MNNFMWAINSRAYRTLKRIHSFCKINGETGGVGTQIEAGQVLGYVGNWSSHNNSGINGRTELTVFKYFDDFLHSFNIICIVAKSL